MYTRKTKIKQNSEPLIERSNLNTEISNLKENDTTNNNSSDSYTISNTATHSFIQLLKTNVSSIRNEQRIFWPIVLQMWDLTIIDIPRWSPRHNITIIVFIFRHKNTSIMKYCFYIWKSITDTQSYVNHPVEVDFVCRPFGVDLPYLPKCLALCLV